MVGTIQQMGGITIQQTTTCPYCKGTGKIRRNNNNCKYCNDTGLEEKEEIITVQIPKGVTKDVTLVNKGMGHQIPKGYSGEPGDLKIVIRDINSDPYEINGYHLIRNLEVPILDIITGTNIEIISPMGDRLKVEIPRNCPVNTALKVSGYGIPMGNQNRNGDIYVVVNYKFPSTLDKSDIKKIEELKTNKNFK
jgi:DnaJ-class molecular chaperone